MDLKALNRSDLSINYLEGLIKSLQYNSEFFKFSAKKVAFFDGQNSYIQSSFFPQ